MNASVEWLRAFVPFSLSPGELRDLLTMRCAAVDEMVPLRADLRDVVVGYVVEAGRHPNSDRLSLTKVDDGSGALLEVVCGAPNVQAGKRYPFARVGVTLPNGVTLDRRKIRGIISNGMLCSPDELGLGDDHDGILELDTDAAPGTPFLDVLPVGGTRLVVDVMPNRPDLLSHLGLAREIAAGTGLPLTIPVLPGSERAVHDPVRAATEANAGRVRVALDDAVQCPRYMGVTIRGVRVADSPRWLAERIVAVGGRPINNVVDVTNYLLHEVGQPMHAFDAAKLAGPAVVVRRARPGERVRTLDGIDRALEPAMLVIADGERASAVAGVMGGGESEVTATTTDLFLEVASFDPASTRRTRRALGLSTDASYRFERGTDVELPPLALARAVRLILELAGGEIEGAPVDLYPSPAEPVRLNLRVARVALLLGEPVPGDEVVRHLVSVGFGVERDGADVLRVTVPSWRRDIALEADLIEEVARLRGYDTFPDELRPFRLGTMPDAPEYVASRAMREALVSHGLLETRPMPFVKGAERDFVRVANPLAENEAYLRRELLDTLARRAEYNLAHTQRSVRLFEIGNAFAPGTGRSPREELRAAAVVLGPRHPGHWTDSRPADFDEWDAKALGEVMARAAAGGEAWSLEPVDGDEVLWRIEVAGEVRGAVRRVSLDAPVWAAPAFGVELRLADVTATRSVARVPGGIAEHGRVGARRGAHYHPLPSTPASEFDVALLVPNDLPAARVEEVIRRTSGRLLEQIAVLSEYRGPGVPEGVRSIAWRLTFRDPERTLQAKEIAGRRDRLLKVLENELGIQQRSA